LETLKDLDIQCAIQPTGTHAHELSMTLNVLYPKLDVTDEGFVGSQILGHLLYKKLSAGPKYPTPKLTDTVATINFEVTALALKDRDNGNKPALCSFASARQDSGKLDDYAKMMKYFAELAKCGMPSLMASEVEKLIDFIIAIQNGYSLSGVGGLLGDSEKIEAIKILGGEFNKTKKLHFCASMAVKIARVWSGIGNNGYTLKTGDGTGKVTIDDKAGDVVTKLLERAGKFQQLHNEAVQALKDGQPPEKLKLSDSDIADKQQLLDRLLDDITQGNPATEGDMNRPIGASDSAKLEMLSGPTSSSPSPLGFKGGRRTRRKVRKVTKKYVRKNIRKSKHIRNRRSNRRNSRK
jgi:hypothetical protein